MFKCQNLNRKITMLILLFAFAIQSYFLYSDETGYLKGPISTLGSAGQKIWHKENCQSCHQIYGFGGHIGPDLTNISSRHTKESFQLVLESGFKQMPKYTFNSHQAEALYIYLTEINQTGKAHARMPSSESSQISIKEIPWFTFP